MADKTDIEWTDATWNPITGCRIVSPGCANCYAMALAGTRLRNHDSRKGLTKQVNGNHVWTGEVRFNAQWLDQPLRWTKPRMIFVCAHGDLFAEGVPDAWIDQVFAVMALAPQHTFQVLTKRPERMWEYLTTPGRQRSISIQAREIGRSPSIEFLMRRPFPLPNVWLGVSVEDQRRADERIPILLDTPAAIRWISAEPLLGQLNIRRYLWPVHTQWPAKYTSPEDAIAAGEMVTHHRQALISAKARFLDWVVAGGESGPNARPMHPDWARALRDQCAAAGVHFLFKQWGEWTEACSEFREADGKHIEVDPDSEEGEALYNHATDRLIAIDGRLFTPETLPNDTPARLVERVGKRRAGRLLDGVEHNAFPEIRR